MNRWSRVNAALAPRSLHLERRPLDCVPDDAIVWCGGGRLVPARSHYPAIHRGDGCGARRHFHREPNRLMSDSSRIQKQQCGGARSYRMTVAHIRGIDCFTDRITSWHQKRIHERLPDQQIQLSIGTTAFGPEAAPFVHAKWPPYSVRSAPSFRAPLLTRRSSAI